MKKLLMVIGLTSLLAACGGVDDIQQSEDEKAKAKTSETASAPAKEEEPKEDVAAEEKSEDIWTYYEDATWSEDYKGLKTTIQKVVVSDKAPQLNDKGEEVVGSAVGVKFQLENTTDGKFTTYPDQAVLVTSTGEQIQNPDMLVSDHIGGEIDKGVIKDGNVIWYLERGEAEKIEWVKLSWSAREGAEDNFDTETKEFEVELKLK